MRDMGECAGSGIPNIFHIWREQGWATPVITEQLEPEQTVLTLTFTKSDDKKAAINAKTKEPIVALYKRRMRLVINKEESYG